MDVNLLLEHAVVVVRRVIADGLLYNNGDLVNIVLAGLLLASFFLHIIHNYSPLSKLSVVYDFHSP